MFLKRTGPLIVCFIMGVLFTVQYYVPSKLSSDLMEHMANWGIIIGGFAAFLGIYSVCNLHYQKIRHSAPGWGYSIFVYVGLALMIILGIISKGENFRVSGEETPFGWGYDKMLVPLSGTMFSLLAFFIASAAFRGFRVKNFPAFLLLISALVVMFAKVPLGEHIWASWVPSVLGQGTMEWLKTNLGLKDAKDIMEWLMNNPNAAARRGIMLGIALGSIAISLKIIFGIERAYLGGEK